MKQFYGLHFLLFLNLFACSQNQGLLFAGVGDAQFNTIKNGESDLPPDITGAQGAPLTPITPIGPVNPVPSTPTLTTIVGGLEGGHFDLDTNTPSTRGGLVNAHTHTYDDIYNVNGVDFFKILEAKHFEIDEKIAAETAFSLSAINAELSPGATLRINDTSIEITKFNTRYATEVFTLTNQTNSITLNNLQISFDPRAISQGGIHPTETGCVKANIPGKNGEYRNGALVIQAKNQSTSAIIWEGVVFWHEEGSCYRAP